MISALESMFGRKCCYCESDYGPVSPTDVEHYRPKGAVVGSNGSLSKPGYYWLAAEWSNLLSSCIDCNRERRHEYKDGPRVTGKANQFPLMDESRRATTPGEEAAEAPLLLDPTRDSPEDHLEFIDEGLVRPTVNGSESPQGKATIKVLGLDRRELNRSRRDRQIWIDDALKSFQEAAERLAANPGDTFAESIFRRTKQNLLRHMETTSPYSAMARQRIRPVLKELGVAPP